MKRFWILKMALMMLLFFAAFSVVVMWLWNWLFPDIFNLPTITIWQAAGILLLSKIIFGFGKKGGHHHRESPWKHWSQKWHNMSSEQKEEWKQKFQDKWCSQSRKEKESED